MKRVHKQAKFNMDYYYYKIIGVRGDWSVREREHWRMQ